MLQGSLDPSSLVLLIHDLHDDKKSGLLLVSADDIAKRIHFREGSIIFANSDLNDDRLGEFLIRTGKIKRPDFDLAIQLMNDLQLRLGGTLVQMGHLSREEMQEGVTEQVRAVLYFRELLCRSGPFPSRRSQARSLQERVSAVTGLVHGQSPRDEKAG
jgi:hypothetical protein